MKTFYDTLFESTFTDVASALRDSLVQKSEKNFEWKPEALPAWLRQTKAKISMLVSYWNYAVVRIETGSKNFQMDVDYTSSQDLVQRLKKLIVDIKRTSSEPGLKPLGFERDYV